METIIFTAPTTATYFLRVTGSGINTNQLYSIDVITSPPASILSLASMTQTLELFADQNGVPDPLETIELTAELKNFGALDALSARATLTGPRNFIPFNNTADLGDIGSGATISIPLSFALDGQCGDIITLSLNVATRNNSTFSFPIELSLGNRPTPLSEDFDASSALPPNWSSSRTGSGSNWSIRSSSSSAPNSIFASTSSFIGESTLISPSIGPMTRGSTLTFRHSYNTEPVFDGGVLEISINGESWQDIRDAGAVFTEEGYNNFLDDFFDNPLGFRDAWTGSSAGFITTKINLPDTLAGQNIQFRWRLGHDSSESAAGWFIDDVVVQTLLCDTSLPLVTLSSADSSASEFLTNDTANVTLSTVLPVATALPVSLTTSGSAGPQADLTGLLTSTEIAVGSSSTELTLAATPDSFAEGPEELTLTTEDNQSLTISILDSPYGNWVFENLGSSASEQAPRDDPDDDLLPNIEEYLFGTNPNVANHRPALTSSYVDGTLRLTAPASSPPDVFIGAKSSPDLLNWEDEFITREGDDFILTPPDSSSRYFMQLTYDLLQTDS